MKTKSRLVTIKINYNGDDENKTTKTAKQKPHGKHLNRMRRKQNKGDEINLETKKKNVDRHEKKSSCNVTE